jgi:Uma2 family endonuclease
MRTAIEIPVKFTSIGGLSDEELLKFCIENDHLRIERDAHGNILIMTPVTSITGNRNFNLATELGIWNKRHRRGKCFDSSAGFILPDTSMRSPDVAFVRNENIAKLDKEDKKGFFKICPDFVIELKSSTDSLKSLQRKMKDYISNRCALGWLVDADNQKVYVYDKDGSVIIHDNFKKPIRGKYFMSDFEIVLNDVLAF